MLVKKRTIREGIEDDESKKLLFMDTYVKWDWVEMTEQETFQWPSSWYRNPISPDALCVLMGSGIENKQNNVKNDFQITFQNVTMDYKMRDIKKEFSVFLPSHDTYATQETVVRQEPEIRITGTTKQGNSICARVRGFLPYFRVSLREGVYLEQQEKDKFIYDHPYSNSVDVDIIKRCIQRYMCMDDNNKESFRLASNHAHLTQFFLREVLIEYFDMLWYALIEKEIGMSDEEEEEEEEGEGENNFKQEEYEEDNEYLKNEFKNLLFDFKRRSITLRNKILQYGDREPVLCPHASRLLSKMEINFPNKEYRRARGVLPNECLWLEIIKKKIGGKGLGENEKLIEIEKKERTFVEDYSKHLHGVDYNNPIVEVHCDLCKAFFQCLEYITKTCFNISKIFLQGDITNGGENYSNIDFVDFFNINNQLNLLNSAWETFSSSVDKTVLEPLENFYREVQLLEEEEKEGEEKNWIYYDESKYMQYVSKVEYEEKQHHTFIDLDENKKSFLRIELFRPPDCPHVRNAIQYAGLLIKLPTLIMGDDGRQQEIFHTDWVQTYESDVPFVTRFSRDTQIDGMGWVVAEPYSWEPIPVWYNRRKDGRERISKCQVEILIHHYKREDGDNILNISGRNTHEHGDEWGETAPIRSLVFDIEVARQTGDLNEFVSPGNPGDLTTQISCYVYEQGKRDEPLEVSLFCLGGCEPILRRANKEEELSDVERSYYKKTRIYCFSCERELFLAFRRFVEINSFDVIVSYNGISFDMVYMLNRNQNVSVLGPGIQAIFGKLGRFIERRVYGDNESNGRLCDGYDNENYKWSGLAYLSKISFQSKQTGLKEYECVKIPGIVQFDIYRVIMANKKLRSYKLDFVMKKLIKMGKLELGHIGITRHAISLYDIHRSVVSRYCEFDTIGTMKVEESQEYLVTYTEMARLTGVVIDDLLTKGQTVKVSSLLMSFTKLLREMKVQSEYTQKSISYMIPYMKDVPMNLNPSVLSTLSWMIEGINDDLNDLYGKPEKEAYVGGHVFEPVRGFHRVLIFCLDFASLYPSIMISFNICYTTHISSKEKAIAMGFKCAWDFRPIEEGGDGPMPADMKEPEGDFWTMQEGHCFVKRHVREGVIPMLLVRILSARSREKRKMNSHFYGTIEWLRHNAAQVALKLTANSVYGFTAANLRGRHISAAVTYMGRYLIQETNKHSIHYGEEHPEFRNSNKYGDSVTADTPVLLRRISDGVIMWKRIDEIAESEESYTINHETGKEEIIFTNDENDDDDDDDEYNPIWEVWSGVEWTVIKKVIRHKVKKPIYRVLTIKGIVDVTEDHSLLDHNQKEISPLDVIPTKTRLLHCQPAPRINDMEDDFSITTEETNKEQSLRMFSHGKKFMKMQYNEKKEILNTFLMAHKDIIKSFFAGIAISEEAVKHGRSNVDIYIEEKDICAMIMFMAERVGLSAYIHEGFNDDFRVTIAGQVLNRSCTVLGVYMKAYYDNENEEEEEEERVNDGILVYDLETENHHFHVGPGNLVVHNTDSVMNSFDNKPPVNKETEEYTTEEMLEASHMAIKIANYVTGIFQAQGFFQIKLEFEKVYKRAVFLKRKKYAVWKFEFDPKDNSFKPHLDSKGLETVRRDTTDFIQEVFQKILEIVVKDGKLEEGIKYAQEQITKLRSGQIPLEKLVITGNFSKRPDQYSNPVPHIEAAKRARLIDPTSAPNVGERISYVVVIRNEDNLLENSKIPLYERTETYRVAKSKGMKIDYPHYVDLCIPILCRFFSACIAPKMSQDEGTEVAEKVIFRDAFEKEESIKKFENSALVKTLGVYKKKRKTFREKEKEKVASKVITIDQLFGKNNNKKKKGKSIKVKKRKKEEKSDSSNDDGDDLNSILTSATSYAEWCKEKGMDIKGRKYKRKR